MIDTVKKAEAGERAKRPLSERVLQKENQYERNEPSGST